MNISEHLGANSHQKQPFGNLEYSNISQVKVQFNILMKWHTGIILSEEAMECIPPRDQKTLNFKQWSHLNAKWSHMEISYTLHAIILVASQ
jgi:hypothetical protein